SFQHSLILALVMLVVGATFFWFVMHGWVVAPLSRLSQAVSKIKPDATRKVTESKALAKERHRIDEIGTLISAVSVMEDEIHNLFRKSDAESQARLHTLDAIMRSMDEGVLLEDSAGQIVYANRRFTQFVGITAQDTLLDSWTGNNLMERLLVLVEDREAYDEAIRRAESGNSPPVVEFRVRGYYNRVGQLVPVRRDVRMRLFLVRDLSGQIIGRGKLFNDVTQQNEAEQVKKNLLAIVSHELRTPLTAIKGYATSLLATDVELEQTLQEHFLQRIVEEGDRMAELVTNLLEMSQLEAGTLKLLPALYRLDALLEQVVPEEQRACVRVTVPEDIPLLYVDRRRIEVVLRNLLENARRHCGADAIIEISARYEQGQADGGLWLDVTDDGPGLPPHLVDRIFDRFYQVDGGRERSSSGVGLGLAICRGFVEAHGGRIWAENRTDGVTGAVFHIWLPPRVLHIPGTQPAIFELHNAL
ncbi:MAG TPA: ATP-binding protein, partial [Ktedonobacteraceae bacterium]|nr:ATP-binding protein [Ktedonobacteraceae bacterium]